MPSSPSTMEAGGQNVGGQVVIEHRHPFSYTNDYFSSFGFCILIKHSDQGGIVLGLRPGGYGVTIPKST